jgi:hypothetical protein
MLERDDQCGPGIVSAASAFRLRLAFVTSLRSETDCR